MSLGGREALTSEARLTRTTRCLLSKSAEVILNLNIGGNDCQWEAMPWHAANWQAQNAILLRSYCMAPLQKSTLLSVVVDKGRRVFGKKSSSTTNPLTSPSTTAQKKFKKSNDARHDMSVLAMTYILQDNSTIRELIRLIIGLNDHDDSGKVCTTCNPW